MDVGPDTSAFYRNKEVTDISKYNQIKNDIISGSKNNVIEKAIKIISMSATSKLWEKLFVSTMPSIPETKHVYQLESTVLCANVQMLYPSHL